MGSGDRPGHTSDACVVPCNPGCDKCCSQSLLLPACSLHLQPRIWTPEDNCCRPAREQWHVTKKIINKHSKISRYSAPLRRAPVSHRLSARSSSKSCYIISPLQDFSSMVRLRQPLGYPLIRPDAGEGSPTWSWQQVLNIFGIRFKRDMQRSPRTSHRAAVLLSVQRLMPSVS